MDTDEKTTAAQTKPKHKKAQFLDYAVIRIGVRDNTMFHRNYTRYKWNGTQ